MADAEAEPFHLALLSLRDRLQEGVYPPGARITAVDLADELRLSTTPVREALSRLAGEGVVEDRRGQGYFVRLFSASDIADLYRMSLAYLLIAQEPRRASRRQTEAVAAQQAARVAGGAVREVEALFRRWAGEAGSRALISTFRILQIQLGPVRRLEPLVLDELDPEAERLARTDAPRTDRLALLRQFHGRRIRVAERLAALLEASARAGKYSPNID
jgi:DNA-binding transcriptional regulator YhcF (GntR family)